MSLVTRFKRRLSRSLKLENGNGGPQNQWARIVMNRETLSLIQSRGPEKLKVLEISGSFWKDRCVFKEYHTVSYPDYDVTLEPLADTFDLIIAEQVLEHIPRPSRAARNIFQMLNPGGTFLVTTPFLLRLHEYPLDCTRWTPTGMRYFLAECGFSFEKIQVYSWGTGVASGQTFALADLPTMASLSRE